MLKKLKNNAISGLWSCGSITEVTLTIDDGLLEDLRKHANETGLDCSSLVEEYVRKGLIENGDDEMLMVGLNDNVVEKANIMAKLTDRTLEEVVNDTLWDNLEKIEDIPDELDGDEIWNLLDHDKPEGDDVLDNLARLGQKGWD